MAAERGHKDIVIYLAEKGADVSIGDLDGVSIHWGHYWGHYNYLGTWGPGTGDPRTVDQRTKDQIKWGMCSKTPGFSGEFPFRSLHDQSSKSNDYPYFVLFKLL